MKDIEQRKVAKDFVERWKGKGYEKGESQKFWIDLLENVLGVSNATSFIRFEDTVHIDKVTGFIDGFIDKTKVLIEQKSIGKDLKKPIKQSDGSLLNPFQQAKRYSAELPYDDRSRWIVTCNFESFLVYDMNNPNAEPEEILLKDLGKEYYRLSFLVDSKSEHLKKEEELSFKAGELVGRLYDAFSKQYKDLSNEQSHKDLNELCVRLVFCLYAEDAGLFGKKNVFHDYLSKYVDLGQMRKALIELFKILDTPLDKRDKYLEDDLNQFPYVNGGLFSNEEIEIPTFTEEIRNTLLARASDEFDWSEISPTIFGAVFESTLNPETRRSGGMHYTSIENIHKVIDPLFLDDLREKLNEAESYKNEKTRNEKLVEFQRYISSLYFFDPACGSGNFLTETYLSLRRLENEALEVMSHGMMMLDMEDTIKVSIQQFYGIEINDFAVKVAKTALWIAEAQMWNETSKIVSSINNINDFLPLESYDNIVEGNALRIDWNEIIPSSQCNYIMGNPPFVGARIMSVEQKSDLFEIFKDEKGIGDLDYVACWYKKAFNYMKLTKIESALVSTNSISQGVQVALLWENAINNGININFAYKTFIWDSEASIKAHVHCVIIGFSYLSRNEKKLYANGRFQKVSYINGYLLNAPNVFIKRMTHPICDVPEIFQGVIAVDNGNLCLNSEEKKDVIKREPTLSKYIRPYIGTDELLNGKEKYCFWLRDINPGDIKKSNILMERIKKVKEFREKSNRINTKKGANTPQLFEKDFKVTGKYIAIPRISSERRKYIPMCYLDERIIPNDKLFVMPSNNIYTFGILESNVHTAWVKTVCGRLKSDPIYSNQIVYNNFPWPNPTKEQKERIEKTAQMILDARDRYPNSSLADLYDELTMPPELRKAHQLNDLAVWEAYGKKWDKRSESDCVSELMKMYQQLVKEKEN